MQAFSGFAALNGEEPGGERVRYYALIDLYCGHLICEAVLAALVARRRDRKPQYIEMTMLGGATSALMTRLASRLRGGRRRLIDLYAIARPTGSTRPPMARSPSRSKTMMRFARCALRSSAPIWREDARFATAAARLVNAEALDADLRQAFSTSPCDWWLVALGRAAVACGRVHADHEVVAHRDTWRRGHLRDIEIRDAGTLRASSPPWDFEGIEPVPGFAPRPGEHTELLRNDATNFWACLEKEER